MIKPCPFCGKEARLIIDECTYERECHGRRYPDGHIWTAQIVCKGCNCSGNLRLDFYKDKAIDRAVKAWNSRVNVDEDWDELMTQRHES